MFTYLIINAATFIIPFVYSFDRRVRFYTKWQWALPALLVPMVLFALWDSWFAYHAIWGFNPLYVMPYKLLYLPIEEWLFFFCIPYTSLFSYEVMQVYLGRRFELPASRFISIALLSLFVVLAVMWHQRIYTLVACVVSFVTVLVFQFLVRKNIMPGFYRFFLCVLIPFLLVNGLLTGSFIGREVVWYNPEHIIGWRILTIPVEDLFFGLSMLLMNVGLFEWLRQK